MSITAYTGQPLSPGMIVCRRSIMTCGFASRPVKIVRVTGSRAIVTDTDVTNMFGDKGRISLSTIAFIVDTIQEGNQLNEASIRFVGDEQKREQEHLNDRAKRKRCAIELAIEASDAALQEPEA